MSETYKGSYAPELFNEDKKYYLLQAQQLANLTDAELRDLHNISNTFNRRFIQTQIGDSAVDTAFQITQSLSSNVNNFTVTGGDGANPAVMYLEGYRLFLKGNIDYVDQTNTGSLTDDGFTETVLPALTTPNGPTSTITDLNLQGATLALTNLNATTPIFVSSDYGRSWNAGTGASGQNLYSVSFSDATGFAAGYNTVLNTADFGSSWVPSSGIPTGTGISYLDIDFTTSNLGWVVGQGGTIFKYTGSWVSVVSSTSLDLSGVSIADQFDVWAVGASGTIINTNDGVSWASQVSGTTNNLARVFAVNKNLIFAVGDNGTVLKNSDGTNWVSTVSDTSQNLHGVFFANSSQGWAVGSSGVLTQTTNGGTTWDATIITPGIDLYAVIFKDTTGYVGGTGGAIYRTLDGVDWEPYRTDYVYIDFHLGEVSSDHSSEYYDSTLLDPVVGPPSANRLRIVSDVKVSEGFPNPSNYTLDGTVQNLTLNIAKILRPVGQANILSPMITDTRTVVRTIAEIDSLFSSGGVDTSAIADDAITPAKIDPTGDYTVGALSVTNDVLIQGDLTVDGQIFVDNTNTTLNNLIVEGNTQLGDSTAPYEDFVDIFGSVQQETDASTTSAYSLTLDSSTSTAIGFDVMSRGKGNVFEVWATSQTTDSTNSVFKSLNLGNGYDFQLDHLGGGGGLLNAQDFGSQDSIVITKDSSVFLGSVLNVQSDSVSPLINLFNLSATDSTTISIDQTSGTMIRLNTNFDANGIAITSNGLGTDLNIDHDGSYGTPVVIYNKSSQGAVSIINDPYNDGTAAVIVVQKGNDTALLVNKDGTGLGRGVDIYNWGSAEGLAVCNSGSGISQIISHVGDKDVIGHDTTNAGLFIYVAGTECGPSLLINKSNDYTGEVVRLINQGFSETINIFHDRSDSSSPVIRISNDSSGLDISSASWWIDNKGDFYTLGDVSSSLFAFDTSHYFSAQKLWLDNTGFDSSNPGVAGRAFIETGFLRVSDGTMALPSSAGGATGVAGPAGAIGATGVGGVSGLTGVAGIRGVTGPSGGNGPTGVAGLTGPAGLQGLTGVQGLEGLTGVAGLGLTGLRGITGLQGPTGLRGLTGVHGQTGLQGLTGVQGQTGFQGETGVQGIQGNTGVQGLGFTGVQGGTGVQGIQGNTGVQGLGFTGVQGETGVQGTQGNTGVQGLGLTGVQGGTGVQGIQGNTGVQGLGFTGVQGETGVQGIQGNTGAQGLGLTGVQGETGVQGTQGNTGVQGLGFTGVQGETGVQGTQGNTGVQGLGLTGVQGLIGDQGVTGVQGGFGLTGVTGSTGVQGQIGMTGVQGQGSTGVQGFQGHTGAQGHTGLFGSTGVQGSTGFQGPTGVQGTIGVQGHTGLRGFTGVQGHTGLQGFTGVQGNTGAQGNTGVQGQTGLIGVQGNTGTQGNTGVQGQTGLQGPTGVQGSTGLQGLTGTRGLIGAQGYTGVQGNAGYNLGATYFLHDATADVTNFNRLVRIPLGTSEVFIPKILTSGSGEVLLGQYVTALNDPDTTAWAGGNWNFYTFATIDDNSVDNEIIFKGFRATFDDSTESLLFYGSTGTLVNSNVQLYETTLTEPDSTGLAGDRLIVRYYAYSQSVSSVTISLYLDGSSNASCIRTPLAVASLQGTTGLQGATGVQGLGVTGVQGSTGVQGFTGVQGEGQTGVQGQTGLQGLTGTQGQTGLQGLTGVQGQTGVQGSTGVQGLAGDTGVQGLGLTGVQGETGVQGTQGNTGVQGLGLTGVQGETGVQGQVGSTGVQGLGLTGVQGLAGGIGSTGVQGQVGSTGVQGQVGSTGVQGLGLTGVQGETGVQGLTGTSVDWANIPASAVPAVPDTYDLGSAGTRWQNVWSDGTVTTRCSNVTTSDYSLGHMLLGNYHLWVDLSGRLRIKESAPGSDSDGTVVGSQS
jgi:hypothetical protein